jgi:hypothetical protein
VGGWAGLGAAVGLGEVGGVVCAVNIVSGLEGVLLVGVECGCEGLLIDVLCPRLRGSGS